MPDAALKVIDRFSGEWEPLSNFARVPVTIYSSLEDREIMYPTAEHAFNAAKTLDPAERAAILAASTPGEAKRLGRKATLRPGWATHVRYTAMRMVIEAKFGLGSPAAAVMLATGTATLIEGNRWHDQHWGDCRCGGRECVAPGANWLGRMLMAQRTVLRGEAL
jgi:ribA/ribD-fused uncharacterized protein